MGKEAPGIERGMVVGRMKWVRQCGYENNDGEVEIGK